MADTIGDMIDKLTIANIRLWHIEDERRIYSSMTKEEKTMKKADELFKKTAEVNKERNSLVNQINASLRVLVDDIKNKKSNVIINIDTLLGSDKNKFYKGEDCEIRQI